MVEDLEEKDAVQVPIEWHIPEDIKTQYATNMLVQHTENEFIVSFFEAWPPFLSGTPEEIKAMLEELKSVRATCISRIVMSPQFMERVVKALQTNLERFKQRKQE